MNFCPFCGKELTESMQFCPFCGNQLTQNKQTRIHSKSKPYASKKLFFSLIILGLIIAVAVFIFSRSGNFSEDTAAIQEASYSVVLLSCYDYHGNLDSSGSGFAAFDKDIIVTNHHVVEGDVYRMEATREDGSTFPIDSLVAYDEEKDLAILRAPNHNLKPLKIGDSKNLRKGEKTVAIGSPTGFVNTVSTGIFSNYLNVGTHVRILSTASISHGSSGGALFNNRGEVIGITSGGYEKGNELYYSIPMCYVQECYEKRTPESEMTIAEFYSKSEHPCSVDYVMAYDHILHGQSITVSGYISGMDSNLFLVSSPEFVLNIDNRKTFNLTYATKLTQQRINNIALEIDISKVRSVTDDFKPGDYIEVEGTLTRYSADDTRLTAVSITKSN